MDNINMDLRFFTVGLMRHPPVNVVNGLCYGHTDVPLKDGWESCAYLPNDLNVQQIYSSPISRCLKLTQKISEQYALPYITDDRLLEFNFGQWEGKMWDDLPRELIDQWAEDPWGWNIPEGENGQKLFDRIASVWQDIKGKQENSLIISHAGPLRLLKQIITQQDPIELLGELPEFGKIETFQIPFVS